MQTAIRLTGGQTLPTQANKQANKPDQLQVSWQNSSIQDNTDKQTLARTQRDIHQTVN